MNKTMKFAVAVLACAWMAGVALAVPMSITYQGVLSEVVSGAVTNMSAPTAVLEVRLYDAATGGAALWGREIPVTLENGAFNMIISDAVGSELVTAALEDVIQGATGPMYIGLTVSGGSEITPRQQMLSTPYAVAAKSAEEAVGSFAVGGNLTVSGSAVVSNQLEVTGRSYLNGNLTVATNGTIAGYGTIPLGGIIMWSGVAVPDGWALCDGATVNGIVTPDLRGRFVLGSGAGGGLTPRTIGQSGGDESITLTMAQMPAHTHTNSPTGGEHTHTFKARHSWQTDGMTFIKLAWNGGDPNADSMDYTIPSRKDGTTHGAHVHPNPQNAGGGQPHNNMPPYYVLAYIMRVK
jgi:microcystin-dependent protein